MKKFAVSLAWFILSIPISFAYDLTGKILDGQTSDPLDFVNVALYKQNDPAPVNGVVTDETGAFIIPAVGNGKYTIQVSFIGYNTYSRNFTVSGQDVDFGEIRLEVENNLLNEIEVVGQGSQMRFEIDRKVFSVDQNIASAGGSATEVLENIPSVEVDQEGNISLRSSESVEVWINGKPSGLTADNRAQILQQMPAESIESIEVITNPSAKFNPEGTAGIINLVLKKDRKAGYYGSVNAGLMYPDQSRLGGNVGANINYSSSKVDAYANIGYRNMGRQGGSLSDLESFDGSAYNVDNRMDDPDRTLLHQENTNNDNHYGLFFRAGADYYINEKNSIGFSGFGMVGGGGSESDIDYLQRYMNTEAHPDSIIRNYGRDNTNDSRHSGFNVNLDYKHEWRKGHDLMVSASYSHFGRDNDKTYVQEDTYPATSTMTTLQNDGGLDRNVELKADYTNKFTETSRLEAGWQTDLSWRSSNADGYDVTSGERVELMPYFNTFNYSEQIHALYVTYGNRFWDKFSAQIGLRGEYMYRTMTSIGKNADGTLTPVDLGDYKRPYFQLFPSVYLGYTLTERDEFQLNYTRRVNRPRGWQINPFKDYSDSTNISFGNPALNPEFASAFELNYLRSWDNHSLSASLYYRFTDDVIQRVSYRNLEAGNMESTRMNISQSNYTGLELIAKNRLFKILNLTTSVNLYYSQVGSGTYTNPQNGITETIEGNRDFSWDARIMGNFMFSPTFTGQLTARYRSPRVMAQGTRNGDYSIDLGLRKSFFNRTLNISANVRDLLNSRRRNSDTWGNGFWEHSESYWSGRTIGLTVTYNFGNMSGEKRRNERMSDSGTPSGMGDEGGMDW